MMLYDTLSLGYFCPVRFASRSL